MKPKDFNIFGIIGEYRLNDWNSVFEEVGENTYLSKNEFKHEESDLNFSYKYGVEFYDYKDGDGWKTGVNFSMVISPKSVCQELIREDCNTYEDFLMYGENCITFGITSIQDEERERTLVDISNIIDLVDSMQGVYFDKCWNQLGTNGWDIIQHSLFNDPLFKL